MAIRVRKNKQRLAPIAIPTRGRHKNGLTWKHFHSATLFVLEEEERLYREAGIKNKIVTHNGRCTATARNAILDHYGKGERVIILDDDIKAFGSFMYADGKNRNVKMRPEEFHAELNSWFDKSKGRKLFGVAPTDNCLNYNHKKKVAVDMFLLGACHCIVVSDIRFDVNAIGKCDYDFTISHIVKGEGTFRLNYMYIDVDYGKMDGGTKITRLGDWKKTGYFYTLAKWPNYLTPNPKRRYEFVLKSPS